MINGTLSNFKLVVRDLEKSLDFYEKLFGLTVGARLDFVDPDVTEVMLENPDGTRTLVLLHGDVMPAPPRVPGYAPLVILIDNIETAQKEIEASGYQVAAGPLSFGPVGLLMVADPDGYLIELVAGDADSIDNPPAGTKIPHPVPQLHDH